MTIRERFFRHVKKTPNCWEWTGYKGLGYGRLRKDKTGKYYIASRLSYEIHKGPIPKGAFICHSCDNRGCVNPEHLWIGSPKENSLDRDQKGRTARIYGESHWLSKYTESQIMEMRRLYREEKLTHKRIGAIFGAHPNYVSLVIRRKRWPHLP